MVVAEFISFLLSSTIHSIFPLPPVSTSAIHGSLSGEVTQIFILKRTGQFIVLPGLCCYNFLLILIPGHGSTKSCPKGSPVFHTYSSLPPLWSGNTSFVWYSVLISPASTITLLCLLIQRPEKPNMTKWHS